MGADAPDDLPHGLTYALQACESFASYAVDHGRADVAVRAESLRGEWSLADREARAGWAETPYLTHELLTGIPWHHCHGPLIGAILALLAWPLACWLRSRLAAHPDEVWPMGSALALAVSWFIATFCLLGAVPVVDYGILSLSQSGDSPIIPYLIPTSVALMLPWVLRWAGVSLAGFSRLARGLPALARGTVIVMWSAYPGLVLVTSWQHARFADFFG